MKRNVGVKDKSIRMLLAMALALTSALDFFPMTVNYILIVVAAIMVITGFSRICPIYMALGKNTNQTQSDKKE